MQSASSTLAQEEIAAHLTKNRIAAEDTNVAQWWQDLSIAFVTFMIIYGLLIFRFGMFTDEIWDQTDDMHDWYTACGRFGVTLYRNVMSYRFVPFAYGVACAVYISAAIVLQMRLLKLNDIKIRIFYIATTLGIVQLSYMMIASFVVDAICLGILLATCSAYIVLRKNSIVWGTCAVVALALALSTYQSLFLLPFCLIGGYFLQRCNWRMDREMKRSMVRLAIVSVSALILYFTVSRCACLGVSDDWLTSVKEYQSSLVTWGQLPCNVHLLHIGKQIALHLIGAAYTGEWLYATSVIPVCILLAKLYQRSMPRHTKMLYGVFVLGLYIGPFLSLVALGEDAGARLHFASPIACALLWVATIKHTKLMTKLPFWTIASFCALVILKASYTVSDMAYVQKRMFDEAVLLISEIEQRAWLTPLPEGVDPYTCPIVVSGNMPTRSEDAYASCVSGVSHSKLYKYLGKDRMRTPSQSIHEPQRLIQELSTMADYPAQGSIRYVDGELLVKLPVELKHQFPGCF